MDTITTNRPGVASAARQPRFLSHLTGSAMLLLLLGSAPAGAIPLSMNSSSPPSPGSTPNASASQPGGQRRPGRIVASPITPGDHTTVTGQRRPGGIPPSTPTGDGVTDAR
jgi:hypothetical protein